MKPAIFLIPRIFKSINKQVYYNNCIKLLVKEGYIPVNILSYEDFIRTISYNYIISIEPVIDKIFVFTDFNMADKYITHICQKYLDKIEYRKFPEEEISALVTNTAECILEETILRARDFFKMNVTIEELQSKCRDRELVLIRDFFFKRAKDKTRMSLLRIGAFVLRDHATALHGIKKVNTEVGLIDEYNRFWGETTKTGQKITDEQKSLIAELKMRNSPTNQPFHPPFENIRPSNNREYTGYRPHSL